MTEIRRHPDEVLGEEEAGYRAGEEVWLKAVRDLEEAGNKKQAEKMLDQQFRRDENGIIFVELDGKRQDLGHISEGYKILTELINTPQKPTS